VTDVAERPLTLRTVLFGDGSGHAITEALRNDDPSSGIGRTITQLPPTLETVGTEQLGEALGRLLQLPLVEIFALGWQKHARLMEAAHRSLEQSQEVEIVDLATHTIRSIHEPRLEVFHGETMIALITLGVTLVADVHALQAVIATGRIVALASGRADLKADLSCDGVKVKSASTTVDLHRTFELADGITLVPPLPATPRPVISP
jgi:hypothetical protein